MRPAQTELPPPETDERSTAERWKHKMTTPESRGRSRIPHQGIPGEVSTRPIRTTRADTSPDEVDPDAEAVELYWSKGLDRDEYGCPTYHLGAEVLCPHCRKKHNHGLGGDTTVPADGYGGHRVAHCAGKITHTQGDRSLGYRITGLDQVHVPAYPAATCRARRGAPRDGAP